MPIVAGDRLLQFIGRDGEAQGVGQDPLPLRGEDGTPRSRRNRRFPVCVSKRATAVLTVGWLTFSNSAAPAKDLCWATAAKARIDWMLRAIGPR